ncbi:MAG: hypothetical protein NT116_06180, partial [Candidatus Parcubacteria bacterium]|nr:hypothetical protein [Candidatus Parcubacteria bacterium]
MKSEAALQIKKTKTETADEVDLSVEIAGIRMQNPIMPAAGCVGYGRELFRFKGLFDWSKIAAIVSKGTTLEPRYGNPQPRTGEHLNGMGNWIGLQNPGIDFVLQEEVPFMAQFGVPVILNISEFSIEKFREIA